MWKWLRWYASEEYQQAFLCNQFQLVTQEESSYTNLVSQENNTIEVYRSNFSMPAAYYVTWV